MLVRDLMKTVRAVKEDAKVRGLMGFLKRGGPVLLTVVDKDNVLTGVVTEEDLIKLVRKESPSPIAGDVWLDSIEKSQMDMKIKDIMSRKVITVSPNDTVDSTLKIMSNYGIRTLPVVDSDNKLIGVIRIRDIFEELLKEG